MIPLVNPVSWAREQLELRTRSREYDLVLKCAALLGQDAQELAA